MGGMIAGKFIVQHPDRALSVTLGGMGWLKTRDADQHLFAKLVKSNPSTKALDVCGRSFAKLVVTEEEIKSIRVNSSYNEVCSMYGKTATRQESRGLPSLVIAALGQPLLSSW